MNKQAILAMVQEAFENNIGHSDYRTIVNNNDKERLEQLEEILTFGVQIARQFCDKPFYEWSSGIAKEIIELIRKRDQ